MKADCRWKGTYEMKSVIRAAKKVDGVYSESFYSLKAIINSCLNSSVLRVIQQYYNNSKTRKIFQV